MLYIDQKEYPHLPYYNHAATGGPKPGGGTVASSGCGLCCLSMAVEHLTTNHLDLADAVKMSEQNGANLGAGTSLRILAPLVAERFCLSYRGSNSPEDVIECLRSGGRVIANVAGDRNGHPGLFSHRQHYVLLIATDGNTLCILDPHLYEGKFQEEGRQGKVRVEYPFAYCSVDDLVADVIDNNRFHLLNRKGAFL